MNAHEFKQAIPLMGENLTDEQIDTLFLQADEDGSGVIEFPEFVYLMKAMNHPSDSSSTNLFGRFVPF